MMNDECRHAALFIIHHSTSYPRPTRRETLAPPCRGVCAAHLPADGSVHGLSRRALGGFGRDGAGDVPLAPHLSAAGGAGEPRRRVVLRLPRAGVAEGLA